jgi:mannose-6-phosphate isomerase-like protein (cupin superfamily)
MTNITNIRPEKIKIEHEDERTKLKSIFNGEFTANQLLELEVKQDSWLGGHYHTYDEIFYVLKGRMDYTWIDIDTGERKDFSVKEGELVRLPSRTYHKAFIKAGTIIISATEKEFESPENNNLIYHEK